MIKKRLALCCVALLCLTTINSLTAAENKTQELKGKIVESVQPTVRTGLSLGDDFWGVATWVIEPGTFVQGPIIDTKGNTIRKGDVLIECDPRFYEYQLDAAKGDVLSAKGTLKDAKLNYERCKKLVATSKVISERERDEAEAALFTAQGEYKRTLSAEKHAQYMVGLCTIRAPFDGFVDQVFVIPGSMNNLDLPSYESAVSLRKLSPLFLELDVDRETAGKIRKQEIALSVYSANTGEAVGIMNSRVLFTENGIRVPIVNSVINVDEKSKLPIVHNVNAIFKFSKRDDSSGPLAVPVTSLHNDEKGEFVWHAVDQKIMEPGKAIAKEFNVKKVYVKTADELKNVYGPQLQKLLDTGGLEVNDVLLDGIIPEGLKDNDKVIYDVIECLFWPGDEVKVVLN